MNKSIYLYIYNIISLNKLPETMDDGEGWWERVRKIHAGCAN